jgi:hypothetical protein
MNRVSCGRLALKVSGSCRLVAKISTGLLAQVLGSGKYQTPPGPNVSTALVPLGCRIVVRHCPLMTKAHSAALACQ